MMLQYYSINCRKRLRRLKKQPLRIRKVITPTLYISTNTQWNISCTPLNVSGTLYTYCSRDSIRVITDETHGERSKQTLRLKCSQYLDRAEELKKHIAKSSKKKEKVTHGASSGHKKDKDKDKG